MSTTFAPTGLDCRTWNGVDISRRPVDGYANATAMCKANGKRWRDYQINERTTQYVRALSGSAGIPAHLLIHSITTGPNELRGTWVHPRIAVDLARWISPEFAVWMDGWFLTFLAPSPGPIEPLRLPSPMPLVEVPWLLVNDIKALCFQLEREGGWATDTGQQLIAHAHWLRRWMLDNKVRSRAA